MLHGLSRRALRFALAAAAAILPSLVTASPAAAQATGFAGSCPTTGFVSQRYSDTHDGIDIADAYGTPIYAVGDGEVINSGPAQGYGQWIRILHPDGTVTEYGHMYRRDVAVGDHVVAGRRIALMGSEGESSGPHLHLRVRVGTSTDIRGIDPIPYLEERGVGLPCTPGSGPRPTPLVYPVESGRVVSTRSADGRLEAFAAGADGVHHAWQSQVNGAWSEWEALSGPGNAELAVAPNADGRLEVFASGPAGVFHKYQTGSAGWSAWEPAAGPAKSQLTSDRTPDGRIEVFGTSREGVHHKWQTGFSTWSAWSWLAGGPGPGVS